MARVLAVCSSRDKGTRKEAGEEGILRKDFGLLGDAHACRDSHRQVSLLAMESIEKFRRLGYRAEPGDFAENLTTEGIELFSLPVTTCLRVGKKILLEITQIGKKCHTGCAIMKETGACIMPKEGVFARVVVGGRVQAGDIIELREEKVPGEGGSRNRILKKSSRIKGLKTRKPGGEKSCRIRK